MKKNYFKFKLKSNVNKITKFKNNLVGKDIKFDISKTWDIKINNSTNRKDINNYTNQISN